MTNQSRDNSFIADIISQAPVDADKTVPDKDLEALSLSQFNENRFLFCSYSQANAIAAVAKGLAAPPNSSSSSPGTGLDFIVFPGQELLYGRMCPEETVNLPIRDGKVRTADMKAAGMRPYFNSFLSTAYKPGLVHRLRQQGYQLMAKSASQSPDSYTLVQLLAESEQLVVSVSLTTEEGGDYPLLVEEENQGQPIKVVFVRTER